MNRYIFIGSVVYSAYCLRALLEMKVNIVDIMCPYKETARFNTDYNDLGDVARAFGKDVTYFNKIIDQEEHIKEIGPDIIFVLGLSQIIPDNILEIPTIGCIGSHPALLPQNRGRHPIIWALANGLKISGITLFWIDKGVDSGDIWGQKSFDIDISDDAMSVYKKVIKFTIEILEENIRDLENRKICRTKQNEKNANYWRKRLPKDGEVDWRMSSKRIYDLVRALVNPYVGANFKYKAKDVKVWKVEIVESDEDVEKIEPGKVLRVQDNSFCVKSGNGIVRIVEHDAEAVPGLGEYLH